jgi:dTMP kinase
MKPKLPCYIMLEGGENVGKGTQLELLEEYLRRKRIDFISVREPGATEQGKLIREILLNRKKFDLNSLTELFLYSADRVETFEKLIIPGLKEGKSILEDRSWPSTFAYQGVAGMLNYTHKGLVEYLNKIATFGRLPDILFIIDGDPIELLKKIENPDKMETKGQEFHKRVRKGYSEIASRYPDISIVIPYQDGKPKEMQEEILYYIKERLKI